MRNYLIGLLLLPMLACDDSAADRPTDAALDSSLGQDMMGLDLDSGLGQDMMRDLDDGIPVGDAFNSPDAEPPCAENRNDEIRLRLLPQCGACHTETTNRPFFATLRAFEELVVYNPDYVNRESPDDSELLRLLEGRGTGLYPQMPVGSEPFAVLADRGETNITMDEIRAWLRTLPPPVVNEQPDPLAITTRRLKAEEIRQALLDQLGLDMERNFVRQISRNFISPTMVLTGPLPLYTPDETPGLHYVRQRSAHERMINLGAPSWLNRQPRSQDITPAFLQTLVQVSQAWCQLSVNDAENTALFRDVDRNASSEDAEAEIRANLAYLYLRFLGDVGLEADIDQIYQRVFLPYEAQGGPRLAWRAVCASFIRHPRWLSY